MLAQKGKISMFVIQGFKVCRYFFVRCDNEPAPWTSDLSGDLPRPLPKIKEMKDATDITERKEDPSWDYDIKEKSCCLWKKTPPISKKPVAVVNPIDGTKIQVVRRKTTKVSFKIKDRLLKEFGCNICHKVLSSPLTTPCAHNFCQSCLDGAFSGQSYIRQRASKSGRTLRAQKNIMKCPSCSNDIAEFLQNPQITNNLEQICYKDLRNEVFGPVKVVLCIYRKLLWSCKEQIVGDGGKNGYPGAQKPWWLIGANCIISQKPWWLTFCRP